MKSGFSRIAWAYLALSVTWPLAIVIFLNDSPKGWEMALMQILSLFVLLGSCIEIAATRSSRAVVLLLAFAVLAGIVNHALYYMQLGLLSTGSQQVFYPQWSDALYFSVVTFTTLGYGDMAPREEYRLVAAFQAIYGYLFLGALVGMLVTVFNRRTLDGSSDDRDQDAETGKHNERDSEVD